MTKKLFVVLVVISALLITFSLVIGANKAPVKRTPVVYEKPVITERETATSIPPAAPIEKKDALFIQGAKGIATYAPVGPVTGEILSGFGGKDFCDLYGSPAFAIEDWFFGDEWYANYQDPEEFDCVAVWPFEVVDVGFNIQIQQAFSFDVQPYVLDADLTDPDCPVPGGVLCEGPIYTVDLPSAGHWVIGLPIGDECCVYGPYFAAVYIVTDIAAELADGIAEDDPTDVCRSYNDWGSGWVDMVVALGWPGEMLLWSDGYTSPQNDCPTEGDSCFATLDPSYIKVLQGDAAVFTANVSFQGEQTECYLVADPDPVCTDCDVTVFDPNPVVDPGASSQVTVQTALTTPPGVYTFQVNGYSGFKGTASIEVVEPSPDCEMSRDNEAWNWFWSGWVVGDMQVMYFDPDELCVQCGDDVYPFNVDRMKIRLYDHNGAAGIMDYIFRIYASTGDPCDGPQQELLSWPVEGVTNFSGWVEYPLPEFFCVNGPFFFALEFNYETGTTLPCALWENNPYPPGECSQWVFYGGEFVEWTDMWTDPKGYMSIRAVGTCVDEDCPLTCDMEQASYYVGSFNSGFEAGDQIVKYFNPEIYCEPEVYPYRIDDLWFVLYDYAGMGAIDVSARVYLECEDSCDGPGTPIYASPPITITDFYGSWAHVVLDEPVCVYEPFFIGIELLEGAAGSTPSMIFDRLDNQPDPYTPNECHTYIYDVSAGGVWREHYAFWSEPLNVGYPFIVASGFTNDPQCDPPTCHPDSIVHLPGAPYIYYVWPIPDAYGDDFFNERFQMPEDHGGRLEYFTFEFDQDYSSGTPDPDFYVWMSDGIYPLDNNPPYQAMADFHLTYGDIVWSPGVTTVQAYSRNITFDPSEQFHIGYSHADHVNDALAILSTDDVGSNRSTEYWNGFWGTMQDDWGYGVDFAIQAYICRFPTIAPTFSLKCTPGAGSITPGDVDVDLYDVEVKQISGYVEPVTLSLLSVTPPEDITATFNPNGQPTPYFSDVSISCGAGVPYGDYVLTFQGLGDDGQTATCNVTLTAQPPYDEGVVYFYHGAQRTSTFGMIGNDAASPNFSWYGQDPLYAGTIVSAMTWPVYDEQEEHMHLVYGGCDYPFTPSQHLDITHEPWCPGAGIYEEDYGEVAYSNFYGEPSVIPGEYDSLFVIGLTDVECLDFSIKIKIYYNPTPDQYIDELYAAIFEDWDVDPTASEDWGDMDTLHNIMWQYAPATPNIVFGTMKAPFYDELMHSMVFIHHQTEVYPTTADSCWQCGDATPPQPGGKYLFKLMSTPGYRYPGYWDANPADRSMLLTGPPFSLNPGEKHIEVWIDFGRDLSDGLTWEQWYHRVLRYAGFYRGDVDASDTLELPALDISDLVYLINYLYKGGPAPIPFADQGDVDGNPNPKNVLCPKDNVDLNDVLYLVNYVYKGGPPPIDYVRFIEQYWWRESLFLNPNW